MAETESNSRLSRDSTMQVTAKKVGVVLVKNTHCITFHFHWLEE